MASHYDAIVIGGGPAGTSAALYAARLGCKTLLLDKGLLHGATGAMDKVLDIPGLGDKPSGEAFIKRMRWQAKDAGAEVRELEVTSVALSASGRMITAKDHRGEHTFDGKSVIVATGCAHAPHALPGEAELRGKGVCYNVVRDAYAYRKQAVAVFGKSPVAAEAVLLLARICETVTFIVPGTRLEIPDDVMNALKSQQRIHLLYSSSIKEIRGSGVVQEVVALSSGQDKVLPITAVFLYHQDMHADSGFLAGAVEVGNRGAVLVDHDLGTSVPGVFACGDILTAEPQLPAIASAQGVMAGLHAARYVRTLRSDA